MFIANCENNLPLGSGGCKKEFNVDKKHSFLIMAHNDFESLKYLLFALDDNRNDIFLHIDKKTSYVNFDEIRSWVKNAGLFFVPRLDVRWGHISFVKCEIELLKHATRNDHYHYYHLLSGVDFPIKSMDYIHEYLSDKNLEYIRYHHNGEEDEFFYKIKYYYPLMRWLGRGEFPGPGKKKALLRKLVYYNWQFLETQRKHGIDRTKKYPDIEFVKGDNWCSITDDFARFLISKEKTILKMYRFTNAPDEIYLPTLAYNSKYRNRIAGSSLRHIDWNRGNPYEFQNADVDELKNDKNSFFARKVSFSNQPELVRNLMTHIGIIEEKKKENPLVSIIVPIYNVQEYLEECLDSLANQNYSNIEVVMVDDGSKDGSTDIAKDYSKKDSRFIYIWQENQGLSAARNTGITHAKGEYIAVVDSDDWVDADYVKAMLDGAIEKNADMVMCGFRKEQKEPQDIYIQGQHTYSNVGAMRVLGNIFTPDYLIIILACNKLIRKSLFENVRYISGKIHEDEYIIHRLIDESNVICTIENPLYHYRSREDSITGSKSDADLRHFDVFEAHQDRVACCRKQKYGDFLHLIVYSMFEELVLLLLRYDKEVYKKYHLSSRFRKLFITECIKNYKYLDKHQKKEYAMAILDPAWYKKRVERITNAKNADAS